MLSLMPSERQRMSERRAVKTFNWISVPSNRIQAMDSVDRHLSRIRLDFVLTGMEKKINQKYIMMVPLLDRL